MCYRCGVCLINVDPKRPQLKHVIERVLQAREMRWIGKEYVQVDLGRSRREIEREVPVCLGCHTSLKDGADFDTLVKMFRVRRQKAKPTAIPAPLKPAFKQREVQRLVVGKGSKIFKLT